MYTYIYIYMYIYVCVCVCIDVFIYKSGNTRPRLLLPDQVGLQRGALPFEPLPNQLP